MNAPLNRDVLLGRCGQCAALAQRLWARLCGDPLLDVRSDRDFARATVQAQYGRNRARMELRVRELERVI